MTVDFKKYGNDRFSQNLAQAINNPRGSLVTGSITAGEVVEVKLDNESSASTTVNARRTGALPLGMSYSGNAEYKWSVSGTILTVELNGSVTGSFWFWVF